MGFFIRSKKAKVSNFFSKGRKGHPIIVSALTFVILYSAMNFGALTIMGEYYLSSMFSNNITLARQIKEANDLPPRLPVAGPRDILPQITDFLSSFEVAPKTDRVIIKRLSVNAPIQFFSDEDFKIRDWDKLEESIQNKLEDGVVHYPGTALPSDKEGNVFITGHSSYYPWSAGRYKDTFAILHAAEVGDEVIVYYEGKKYIYEIESRDVISPDNVEVLRQGSDRTLTLMTCTPIGTNKNRLILQGRLVEEK